MNRKTYNQGEEIECSKEIAESLLGSGAITENAPAKPFVKQTEKVDDVFINPFTEIELDEKTAKLLVEAGISNMDELSGCDAKKLEAIKGISKKQAKEIMDCFEEEAK
jgi:DNA-directed RNA polymerase alpha subunit